MTVQGDAVSSAADDFYPTFEGDRVRDRLIEALKFDLLGPEAEDEILLQSPRTRYLVGQLAPRNTEIDAVEDEQNLAQGEDEDGADGQGSLRASLEATSIGLSVVVDSSVTSIDVVATWGEYETVKKSVEEEVEPEEALDPDRDADPDDVVATKTREITEWHRYPRELRASVLLVPDREESVIEERGVNIRALVRRFGDDRIVSVFLVNAREAPLGKRPPDTDYLYQPRITIEGSGVRILPRKPVRDVADPDPDIASADLIYRNRKEYAVGHGVAADWSDESDGYVSKVWTEIMPTEEVPRVTPRESERLSMDYLAERSKEEVTARLREFLTEYEEWLGRRETEAGTIEPPLRSVAKDHVMLAKRSLARMSAGIDALEDDLVFKAFQFSNRAMALQRRRSVQIRNKRRSLEIPEEISANWRPFQVGFILQALSGLAHPLHDDREVADLLWFPTGGGKTEAYLGLTAFIIALRRLRGDDLFETGAGTAVIMRYTLRLLTIQQFQRALTLITACEVLRTRDPKTWGYERITIGLWVGKSVTPNSYAEAKAALNKLKNDQEVFRESPYQILFCPWCGDDLTPHHYVTNDEYERVEIKCWNQECDFHTTKAERGIPALVVDEEIYRNPPALLLATVDKFAQMTWNGRIQTLFGRVQRHCERHGWISNADPHPDRHQKSAWYDEVVVTKAPKNLAPPDLVIQDELHLISGPLGTLVGIYETAVDALCSYSLDGKLIRPKVVASTATVRRAQSQVRSLFDREISVFPPLGLDAADSFFASEDREEPGRKYVGIFGPGKSIKTTLVRTYGALLGRSLIEHRRAESAETDAYMTLVGYFNSLRELGGALRLVEDDVRSRLRALKRRGFSDDRIVYNAWELTSRKSSSLIGETLDALERTFIDVKKGRFPLDVLLSSNMISVGVDIDRLGLMVVSGQPKTTAEYIQATSRVGREHPGLVVQVYNWIRPRDISHYERFHHYHSTFYRHVEATSVTPFSERARDRALPGVLVAHSRLDEPDWSREQGAGNFDPDRESVKDFVDFMIDRARHVARHGDDVADELRQQLEAKIFKWGELARDPQGLVYSSRGQDRGEKDDSKKKAVLLRQMELEGAKGEWVASGSLREVEEEVPIVLRDYDGADS